MKRSFLAVLVALAMVATACGDDDDAAEETTPTTAAPAETTTTAAAAEETTTTAAAAEETTTTAAAAEDFGDVLILSTQGVPVEEAESIRNDVLAGFNGSPEFVGAEEIDLLTRVEGEVGEDTGSVDAIIALHGTYPTLQELDALRDLSDVAAELSALGIPETFLELGKLGTDTQYYIPLMQATYLMGANTAALEYLPEGADIDALTWQDLSDWGQAIADGTGSARLGFPAADDGLLHRVLEGYIYPSFTGGMVTNFDTPEAVAMWEFFKGLWEYANPQSTTYSFMQDQLLSEEVWVALDHQARLKNAFDERPDDFVAFPAPTGPEGLGFMPVLVGISVPKNAPNEAGALEMVNYMMSDATQTEITKAIGFFPATAAQLPDDVSAGVKAEGDAVGTMTSSPDALPALLPVGLGERGGEINKIFRDAFTRIVLQDEDIASVLKAEGDNLQLLMDETGAPCWPPDPPSTGACQLNR